MIRFAVADLVLVAAEVLDLDTDAVLDLLDIDAAAQALADPVPAVDDPAARAGALLHGLLEHRPLPRGNRRLAVLATAQFLAVNGWQLDLEPVEDLAGVLRAAEGPSALAAWLRPRIRTTSSRPEGAARPKGRAMFGATPDVQGHFNERARRAIVLAREEARLHQHNYVGTEHLLLGLIHEGDGIAARALRSFDVDLEQVRGRVDRIIGRGSGIPRGRIQLTPRGEHALDLAVREAGSTGSRPVATEHVLLGVLRESGGVGAMVLAELGLDLEEVRERVLQLAAEG